jgi:membrane protease YdiL (CAAX protease family)
MGLLIMGFGYVILLSFNQIKFISATFFYSDFLIVFFIFLSVAFTEEALFRGYILRNLMNSMNKNIALIVTAVIFTAMHALNQNITFIGYVNLFLAGILLGLPYIYTKNLWFPISFHFSWNYFQSLLGFNVSGKNSYSIVNFDLVKKNHFNGGDFGFEGSVFSVLTLTVLIMLAMYYFNRYWKENKKTVY